MLPDDTYHTHLLVAKGGKVSRHPAGRFLIKNGVVHHMEDYHGALGKKIPEGAVDDLTEHVIKNPGPDLSVASSSDIASGRRLDFVKEHPLKEELPPPVEVTSQQIQDHVNGGSRAPVWAYTRVGHDRPHVLESKEGKFTLDGNPLEPNEVSTILDNVRTRKGKIRYMKGGAAVAKAELEMTSLRKADDMDIDEAFAHLDKIAGNDDDRQAVATARRTAFEDEMVPGLGNKLAYKMFAKKNTPGATVVGDANFFKGINDEMGHQAGDDAITAMGGAWRDASREVGGKAHRFGGDEFHAHFPTYEHAAQFARALRGKLDAMPPVGGTRKLSMSVGIGHDFPSADKAVYHAKQKKALTTPETVPPLLAHSLHHGFEGAVPVDSSELQLQPPELPAEPSTGNVVIRGAGGGAGTNGPVTIGAEPAAAAK